MGGNQTTPASGRGVGQKATGTTAGAVAYPGLPPGPAHAACTATQATLENGAIAMEWDFRDGGLSPRRLAHRQTGASLDLAQAESFILVLGQTPFPQPRPVRASELALAAPPDLQRIVSGHLK